MNNSAIAVQQITLTQQRPGYVQVTLQIERVDGPRRETVAVSVELAKANYPLDELQRTAVARAQDMLTTILEHGLASHPAPSAS